MCVSAAPPRLCRKVCGSAQMVSVRIWFKGDCSRISVHDEGRKTKSDSNLCRIHSHTHTHTQLQSSVNATLQHHEHQEPKAWPANKLQGTGGKVINIT